MSVATTEISREQFLEWECLQARKNEYLGGLVRSKEEVTQVHVLVAGALASCFREHLRGTRCRTYVADMKLQVQAADAVFYPDVMVSCDEADRQRATALQSPCLLVEVLSDSTAAYDRGAKFAAYRRLPSLQEYLLVDVAARRLELFRRESVGWVLHEPEGEPQRLWLASIGLALSPDDAFADLQDTPEPDAALTPAAA
jgi:Uma2 family endonuclease